MTNILDNLFKDSDASQLDVINDSNAMGAYYINIEALIKHGESETLEFKKSIGEWKEIIETISAFSNIHGGTIIIGVSKSGQSIGIEIGKGAVECLANQISQDIDPKINPSIIIEKIKDKSRLKRYSHQENCRLIVLGPLKIDI